MTAAPERPPRARERPRDLSPKLFRNPLHPPYLAIEPPEPAGDAALPARGRNRHPRVVSRRELRWDTCSGRRGGRQENCPEERDCPHDEGEPARHPGALAGAAIVLSWPPVSLDRSPSLSPDPRIATSASSSGARTSARSSRSVSGTKCRDSAPSGKIATACASRCAALGRRPNADPLSWASAAVARSREVFPRPACAWKASTQP